MGERIFPTRLRPFSVRPVVIGSPAVVSGSWGPARRLGHGCRPRQLRIRDTRHPRRAAARPATGAVIVPIYATSTFAQDGVGGCAAGTSTPAPATRPGPRSKSALAALEAAVRLGVRSGMAATDARAARCLRPGDHVVIPDDAYGGTFRLIDKVFTQWGVELHRRRSADLDAVARRATPDDPADLGRDADQPAALHRRHRRARRTRARRGREAGGGQHVRHAVPAAAADARRRHRACTRPPSTSAATPMSSAARW